MPISTEFAERRQRLMSQLGPDSIAILPAATVQRRNGDVTFPYRQQSDFYYLTGFIEPEAIAVLLPGDAKGEYILFNKPRDQDAERWDGAIIGQDAACTEYGADQAYPLAQFSVRLPELCRNKKKIFYDLGTTAEPIQTLMALFQRIKAEKRKDFTLPTAIADLNPYLAEMRLFKSTSEIAALRKACEISAAAHRRVMQACRPGLMEYALEAEFLYECGRQGSRAQAYEPIIAGGANACTLHYRNNNQALRDGELVLVDAGCEYNYYAADITRTFPSNGRFSTEQRAIYTLVLQAQEAALAQLYPGNNWLQPQIAVIQTITQGLIALGILPEQPVEQLVQARAYEKFYMHGYSHWLGLDVHDAGNYKQNGAWRNFEPGMTLTVEPGIYIAPHSDGVAEKWWGIGVRIEDDVLITPDGHEILSVGIPKTITEIETLMSANSEHKL